MSIELDVEELEELKEQAFLEGVVGCLVRVKALLTKEGDPKEVLEKAIKEIEEMGTTADGIFNNEICHIKFCRKILSLKQS